MTDNLTFTIDRLGALKAQIADLIKEETAIKAGLAELGVGTYCGDMFQLAISESVRETLDMEAVRAKLSPQFIRCHIRETEVRSFRVSARSRKVA